MSENNGRTAFVDPDREVIRCKTCALVQYRTRAGSCRRCLHVLTSKVELLIPPSARRELPVEKPKPLEKELDCVTVDNVGHWIRRLRDARGMTQSQLQERAGVSRSYLSRIECGEMTPSIGLLEKISEAFGLNLNRFFRPEPESNGETLLDDPFIQDLRPFLRQLDWTQWQSVLRRLQAISEHASTNAKMRTMPPLPPAALHTSLAGRAAVAGRR